MDFLQVLILSIVEGITEFLPISSTGHLVLTSKLLNIDQTEFVKTFEIFIQLGAILAVVFLYWKTLLTNKKVWLRIFLAFLPTALIGLTFYKLIKDYLLGNIAITLTTLFLGGIALILIEKIYQQKDPLENLEQLSLKRALFLGLIQSFSMVPGVSRAAVTILGGMFLGLSRQSAAEFSFFLAVPTMLAAGSFDLIRSNFAFSSGEYFLLGLGFTGAFISALLVIKYFIKYVAHHTFIPFGVYRIILAVLFWLVVIGI